MKKIYDWSGRQVVVVGLGRSGVASAQLLRHLGASVRATDSQDSAATRAARTLLKFCGVEEIELGSHSASLMAGSDAVVVSPGVPESAAPIRWALEQRVPVLSEVELAFQNCQSPIVAVTGTNGKSTVVTLIAAILQAARRPAIACGNLGTPFSSILDQLTPDTTVVLEVSSFQLLACDQFRPRIGVLLNIGTNHLDRHQDREAYLAAKLKLFARQSAQDWAVLNGADALITTRVGPLGAKTIWFGDNRTNPPAYQLADVTREALTECHQAVLQVARLLEVPDPLAWQVIRSFQGLEHRLEPVADIRGVHFVNDSKSTTPESCLYALEQTRGPIVLILGGRDKGMDFNPLINRLHDPRIQGVVLIGESRSRLRAMFNGSPATRECGSLDEAVQQAGTLAGPGTTVLFSPACASFDMFRDFEHRGRSFKELVWGMGNTS